MNKNKEIRPGMRAISERTCTSYAMLDDISNPGIFVMQGKPVKFIYGDIVSDCKYIGESGKINNKRVCIWECSCGKIFHKRLDYLRSGVTTHCGCKITENRSKSHITHGLSRTKAYDSAIKSIRRCVDPSDKKYKDYGGRGISVYKKWVDNPVSFIRYIMCLDNYHKDNYILDRIDNNGNYEPGNLRWTTYEVSNRNRRSVINFM
jgi:hypothetical protein